MACTSPSASFSPAMYAWWSVTILWRAPLPRREPVQRRLGRQRLRQPAAAEPLAHAVDGVVDLGVVGDEDVFQRPVAQLPRVDGRDQVARPQAQGDGQPRQLAEQAVGVRQQSPVGQRLAARHEVEVDRAGRRRLAAVVVQHRLAPVRSTRRRSRRGGASARWPSGGTCGSPGRSRSATTGRRRSSPGSGGRSGPRGGPRPRAGPSSPRRPARSCAR